MLLQTAMKVSGKKKRELHLVFLDLVKAFDTIQHESIEKALVRKGVPKEVREMVGDLYTNTTTVFKTPKGHTRRIEINVGIKQGCPLSPLLFNLVMDELLERIAKKGCGAKIGEQQVSWLLPMTSCY